MLSDSTIGDPLVSHKTVILIYFMVQLTCWVLLQFLELKMGMQPSIRSRNIFKRNTITHMDQNPRAASTKTQGFQIQTRGSVYLIKSIWQSIGLIYCIIAISTDPVWFVAHFDYSHHRDTIQCQNIYNIYALVLSYYVWEMSTNRYVKLQRSVAIHHWLLCAVIMCSLYFDSFSPLITLYIIVGVFSGGIPINIALCARDSITRHKQIRKYTKSALTCAAYWYLVHLIVLLLASCVIIFRISLSGASHGMTLQMIWFIWTVLCMFAFAYNDIITVRALFQLSHLTYPILELDKNKVSRSVTRKSLMNQILDPYSFYYAVYPICGTRTECDLPNLEDVAMSSKLFDDDHSQPPVYLDGLDPTFQTQPKPEKSMPSYMTNDSFHFMAKNGRNHAAHTPTDRTNDGLVELSDIHTIDKRTSRPSQNNEEHQNNIQNLIVHISNDTIDKMECGITPISTAMGVATPQSLNPNVSTYDSGKSSDDNDSDHAQKWSDESVMQNIWANPSKTATPHSAGVTPSVNTNVTRSTNLFTLHSGQEINVALEMPSIPAPKPLEGLKLKKTKSSPLVKVTSPIPKATLHPNSKSMSREPYTPNSNFLSVAQAQKPHSNKERVVSNQNSYYQDIRFHPEILPSQIGAIQSHFGGNSESGVFKMTDAKQGIQQDVVLVKHPLSQSMNAQSLSPSNSFLLNNDPQSVDLMGSNANTRPHAYDTTDITRALAIPDEVSDDENKYWFKRFIYHMDEFFAVKERIDDGIIIDYDEEESLSLDIR